MASPNAFGDLTKSGLLYEGNFSEWSDRMKATWTIMSTMQDSMYTTPGHLSSLPHGKRDLMLQNISPHLLARVPHPDRKGYARLLASLTTRAQPFRFFDLPLEIRQLIYEYALFGPYGGVRKTITEFTKHRASRLFYAPLVRASSIVRTEALPVFISGTRFSDDDLDERKVSMPTAIFLWLEAIDKRYYKYLRTFILEYYVQGHTKCYGIKITISPAKGLAVQFSKDVDAIDEALEQRIVKHISDVEGTRRMIGM